MSHSRQPLQLPKLPRYLAEAGLGASRRLQDFSTPPASGFLLSPGLAPIDHRLSILPSTSPPEDYFNFTSAYAALDAENEKGNMPSLSSPGRFPFLSASQAIPDDHLYTKYPLDPLELASPSDLGSSPSSSTSELPEERGWEDLCLDQHEFLALSPQQDSILQEVHQEARKRTCSSEGFDVTMDSLPPANASPPDLVYHFPKREETAEPLPEVTLSLSLPRAPAELDDESMRLPPTHSVSAVLPKSRRLSLVSDPVKTKQLGSFPAEEAFSTSLDQLHCADPYGRPPYLWWTLIRTAILGAPGQTMQMDTLCHAISTKFPYFGSSKDSKNWKSSIRSVIHTKPCFYKTEDSAGFVWWHVDVNVDPREQRRGLKKRAAGAGRSKASAASKYASDEENGLAGETDTEDGEHCYRAAALTPAGQSASSHQIKQNKRRRTA